MWRAAAACAGVVGVLAATAFAPRRAAATVPAGWQTIQLPGAGSYCLLYVPESLNQAAPAPLVVFLHGSGSTPEVYENDLGPPAIGTQTLVVVPKSSSNLGWGFGNDDAIIAAAEAAAKGVLAVDPRRISIAGHSAGGAYAYLTAYLIGGHYSAVFSLSAPFYPVGSLANSAYKAPIRMYYGTMDPNYVGGSFTDLTQQWTTLGVTYQSDIEPGWSHDQWPPYTMLSGFQFLVAQAFPASCTPDAAHMCLQQGRFRVSVQWQDSSGGAGGSGAGSVVPGAAALTDSGLFWFFDPGDWELMVKVLNGCAVNQMMWVFTAGSTNVQYTLTVTDTVTGTTRTYQNPAGQLAAPLADTNAFAACGS